MHVGDVLPLVGTKRTVGHKLPLWLVQLPQKLQGLSSKIT